MRNRSIGRLISAALACAVALSIAPNPGLAAEPYEINVIAPLTGGAAFIGKEEAASLGVIEALANKSGGIAGRPVKFQIYDDQSNAQIAVQLANQIIAKKVPVILGPSLVATCNAIAPLLKDGPVMYCFSPGIYPASGSNAFSGSVATRDMIAVAVRYFRERGWNKIGVLNPTDATGQDGDRALDAAFAAPENRGMSIVAREHFNLTDLSVSAQMSRMKSSGAQALVAWVTGTAFGTALRGAADAGLDVPIVSSTGNLLYPQLESQAAVIGDRVLFPATPGDALDALPPGALRTTVANYLDAMRAAGLKPDQGHTLSWDPAWIVIEALRKRGTAATAAQLREYIANLRGYAGINGIYDFRAVPQRGLGPGSIIMVRWLKAKDAWESVSVPGGALPK